MNMLYDRSKDKGAKVDKNPYNRRAEKDDAKAFKANEKGVKPVAKDTNKTRRKIVKPTAVGKPIHKKKAPKPKMAHKVGTNQ